MEENKMTSPIEELKTLKEFQTEIPETINELWIHDRCNNILSRGQKKDIIKKFGKFKVLNYFEKSQEIWDIFILK